MTNAKYFLKEGASAEEFVKAIEKEYPYDIEIGFGDIQEFLNAPAKPTLTEDERVILRNIKNKEYKYTIGREDDTSYQKGKLYLRSQESYAKAFTISTLYNHLFQFIKERRRIFNKRIIRRGKVMEINFNEEEAIICFDGVQITIQKDKALKLADKILDYFEYEE